MSDAVALGAATASALGSGLAVFVLRRALVRLRTRLARLSAQAAALAAGETPPFVTDGSHRELSELERNMVALTTQSASRAVAARAETATHNLGTQLQRALSMVETEDGALDVASHAMIQAAPSSPAELLLANESESELHLAAVGASGAPGCPVATPSGCAAMRAGHTLRFSDESALDICPHLRNRRGGPKSAVCIPLAPARGTTGVLHATSDDGPISDDGVVRLELVAAHLGSRLQMLHVLSVFQTQAETDPLTGLINRRSFEQRATNLIRSNRKLALAIADLDQFKKLNDTHGHATGDHALRIFARVARAFATERAGFVARLGGEEFAVVLPLDADASLEGLFDPLRGALDEATSTGACPRFTVSLGVAGFPAHGSTLSELLDLADRALYKAKSRGRDCAVVHGSAAAEERPVMKLVEVA